MNTYKTLADVVRRATPEPWRDGDNIPWSDPAFSERMLKEHLAQHHDAASRRASIIDAHVQWIHHRVLQATPGRVLDLACGPGLYASRLAGLGHDCTGIDYSPASIAYAAAEAHRASARCTYVQADLRHAAFGADFTLVMLISGELNVFRRHDAAGILRKARESLIPDGALLLEVHPLEAVREIGRRGARWTAAESGLFAESPYLQLTESIWDGATQTATVRYFIIDAAAAAVRVYAQTYQAYADDEYRTLLRECGFDHVEFVPSLIGAVDESQRAFAAIVARRSG